MHVHVVSCVYIPFGFRVGFGRLSMVHSLIFFLVEERGVRKEGRKEGREGAGREKEEGWGKGWKGGEDG